MFIEDDELRNLYKTASEEHLQKLEAGFLLLERQPEDLSPLKELLREAHSLKGDSRMLGVTEIESLIHQIEHILGQIQQQQETMTPDLSDRLYRGLDAIGNLVQEAVTGNPSGVKTFQVLAMLMGAKEEVTEEEVTEEDVTEEDVIEEEVDVIEEEVDVIEEETIGEEEIEKILPSSFSPNSAPETPYRIDTIRVNTHHLDDLVTQTGELSVTRIRIASIADEIEELRSLWEEWQRHTSLSSQRDFPLGGGSLIAPVMNHPPANQNKANLTEKIENLIDRLSSSTREHSSRLDSISTHLEDRVRTLRLLPLSNLFNLFPRLVRDLARSQEKNIELTITGGETNADKRILEDMKDPLIHLLRNAIDHGIETPEEREKAGKPPTSTLRLTGSQTASQIIITISDDGRGLDSDRIKRTAIAKGIYQEEELAKWTRSQLYNVIFLPGFSTRTDVTAVSGRGVGLDVVRTNVEQLKGSIEVDSTPGQGTTFSLRLGITLATASVLLVKVCNIIHAIPLEAVKTTFFVAPQDIFTLEGRETIALEGQATSIAHLATLLELEGETTSLENSLGTPCILLEIGDNRLGLLVNELLDTQEVVLKPQSQLLKRVRNVSGATILGNGEVCTILNPGDLLRSVQQGRTSPTVSNSAIATIKKKLTILLAEDSITIRTQEKRILEEAGYEVTTAVDGLDGLNKLRNGHFDAVISDIQMPNLDGLQLAARIRQNPEYNELPIILVTSLASDEDKKRGVEAGANAYIPKGSFDRDILLDTLKRLV
ncbi:MULTISPECIES: hybrid sensor histidine kinase/response regulator [Spirulina sp. CCY15215]|uniref:hybrid sensor histidine kinase/response regulator n=1 Tax=Spirulina sp. CCY15215 TaxID=2767591 RepID=UPI00195206F6|nr:hybrid sensor histidine kinase/response regulator [Spirulina major]